MCIPEKIERTLVIGGETSPRPGGRQSSLKLEGETHPETLGGWRKSAW